MRRAFGFVVAAVVLILGAPAAHSDDDGNVFDTSNFDKTVQQATQQEQKAKLETQLGGTLLYDTSAVTTTDLAGYGAAGSFSGKGFAKVSVPDYGSLYLAYNFSKNLYQGAAGSVPGASYGSGGPVLSQAAGDLYGVSYALAEFYASVDIFRAVYLRVGNQLLAWGPSIIWTPVDFINLQRVNPLSPLDLRVGKPGIRVTVPLGTSDLFLFTDMSGTVTPTGPGGALVVNDLVKTTNLAGRWDVTVGGAELAVSGYTGQSVQSRAGFDVSGRMLGADVYGELAAAIPTPSASFSWSTSAGFQKTLGELSYWSVSGELYYGSTGTSDTGTYPGLAAAQMFNPFYVGSLYAYAALTRTHIFIDGVSMSLAGFADFSDASFLARLSTTFDVPGVPPFTFNLTWAGGGPNKAFTYFSGNNSLTAELQLRVQF
jgi:hypothetical protein